MKLRAAVGGAAMNRRAVVAAKAGSYAVDILAGAALFTGYAAVLARVEDEEVADWVLEDLEDEEEEVPAEAALAGPVEAEEPAAEGVDSSPRTPEAPSPSGTPGPSGSYSRPSPAAETSAAPRGSPTS